MQLKIYDIFELRPSRYILEVECNDIRIHDAIHTPQGDIEILSIRHGETPETHYIVVNFIHGLKIDHLYAVSRSFVLE